MIAWGPVTTGQVDHAWQPRYRRRLVDRAGTYQVYLSLCGMWKSEHELARDRHGSRRCKQCYRLAEREASGKRSY